MAKEVGGHGGMDFVMAYRLVECMTQGLVPDIDVYDAAAWSAPAPLSEARGQGQHAAEVPRLHARRLANPPARVRPMHRRNRLRHHDRSWVSARWGRRFACQPISHKF